MRKIFHFHLITFLLFCPFLLWAQEFNLSGVVVDNTGETLPGVSIAVKGTTRGVITDMNGAFQLKVSKGETLVFSYVGYDEQQILITNQKILNIRMEPTTMGLDEVVVVGYGTQSKRTVTSAISKVDGETLKATPINTVGEGLKGKIAGVRVYNENNTPGAEATFLIRGGSSISQSNSPLILVDGVERSTAGINPNDIESIEVLKDAASSAIYGSRASNGVVLITTRKGKSGAPRVTFEASFANENVERMIEYLDATQAVTIMRDRWASGPSPEKLYLDGYAYSSGNTDASKFSTRYLRDGESIPAGWKSVADPLDPSKTLIFEDNDWASTCFKNALWQNYYVGIEGGTEKLSYVGSIGYMKDSGVGVGTAFDRFNARTNVTAKIRENLTFSSNIDYSQTNSEEYASQYQVISRGLMTPAVQRKYWVSDNEWYGTPTPGPNSSSPNPSFYSYFNDNNQRTNRLGLVGSLDWEVLKGWHAVGTASLFTQNSHGDTFMRANPMNGTRKATTNMTDEQRKKLEFYTSYTRTFADKHSISAMVGYSYQQYLYKYVYAATTGHSSDKIPTLNGGSVYSDATSTKQEDVNIGYFGRLNYDYLKRYMLTATFLTGLNPDNFRSVINGKDTGLYILRNGSGMEMCVTNYGAIVLSIMAPDSHGKFENVVIGFDTLEEARRQSKDYYIGATIGPVAGRILHGAFRVGEKDYHLQLNSVSNTLHSGDNGFHTVVWEAQQPCENQLLLRHFHADGEAGFPGNVTVRMMYTLTDDNGFRIDYEAETDRDTLFCPTNHAYFNLAGMGTPTTSIEDHLVRINADFYLPIDMNTNNTGEVRAVGDTPFDFRDYHSIGERINRKDLQLLNGHGYDHCFVLKKPALHELSFAATCISPSSGRRMDIYTTEPGLIMYTGNYLPGFTGMHGTVYPRRSAVCFETQCFPDTPNNPHFPSIVLREGDLYKQTCIYQFSTQP